MYASAWRLSWPMHRYVAFPETDVPLLQGNQNDDHHTEQRRHSFSDLQRLGLGRMPNQPKPQACTKRKDALIVNSLFASKSKKDLDSTKETDILATCEIITQTTGTLLLTGVPLDLFSTASKLHAQIGDLVSGKPPNVQLRSACYHERQQDDTCSLSIRRGYHRPDCTHGRWAQDVHPFDRLRASYYRHRCPLSPNREFRRF